MHPYLRTYIQHLRTVPGCMAGPRGQAHVREPSRAEGDERALRRVRCCLRLGQRQQQTTTCSLPVVVRVLVRTSPWQVLQAAGQHAGSLQALAQQGACAGFSHEEL